MMPRFDDDIVLAKVSQARKGVATIRELWDGSGPELPDWVRMDVTVLNLQRAIEACLDLAHHLLAANEWGLPGSGAEAFDLLARHSIVHRGEVETLKGMVGFRNIAVHSYRELREEVVVSIVRHHLADLEGFAARVVSCTLKAEMTDPKT